MALILISPCHGNSMMVKILVIIILSNTGLLTAMHFSLFIHGGGANNDHVTRHRAPLFMAQVDQERLCILRDTEEILIPERGARLGNFGVTEISENETWVTVSEWMQPEGVEKYGSDGSVFIARLKWKKPNRLFQS